MIYKEEDGERERGGLGVESIVNDTRRKWITNVWYEVWLVDVCKEVKEDELVEKINTMRERERGGETLVKVL